MTWGQFGIIIAVDYGLGVLAYWLRFLRGFRGVARHTRMNHQAFVPLMVLATLAGGVIAAWALGHLIPISSQDIPAGLTTPASILVALFTFGFGGACVIEIKQAVLRR